MKISTFVELYTAALYNETELSGQSEFRFGDILDKYSLQLEAIWSRQILQDRTLLTYIDISRHIGPVERQRVAISPTGVRWVEDTLGENVAQFLEAHGAIYTDTEPTISDVSVDSTSWTGLPKSFVLTDEKRTSIIKALDTAEALLPTSVASQHDQAQAHAYITAARTLLEAPEPESEFAWQLIGRANNLAGIASLLIAIIALFK